MWIIHIFHIFSSYEQNLSLLSVFPTLSFPTRSIITGGRGVPMAFPHKQRNTASKNAQDDCIPKASARKAVDFYKRPLQQVHLLIFVSGSVLTYNLLLKLNICQGNERINAKWIVSIYTSFYSTTGMKHETWVQQMVN